MSGIEQWNVRDILAQVEPGDGWDWECESALLWDVHADHLRNLTVDIRANGIRTPIEVARTVDGKLRMWDGHHRVLVAAELGLPTIPVHMNQETE